MTIGSPAPDFERRVDGDQGWLEPPAWRRPTTPLSQLRLDSEEVGGSIVTPLCSDCCLWCLVQPWRKPEWHPCSKDEQSDGWVIDITDIKFSDAVGTRLLTLKVGDVLFNRTNSLEHVGKTAMWRGELAAASFASYLVRLDVDVQKMRPAYLVYWLNLASTQIAIRRFATPGVHQVNINPTNLRRMECAAPKDLVEQDAIARRVEQLEKFISIEELQVAKLRQQKHGLMHDLLTGRVRVKVAEPAST